PRSPIRPGGSGSSSTTSAPRSPTPPTPPTSAPCSTGCTRSSACTPPRRTRATSPSATPRARARAHRRRTRGPRGPEGGLPALPPWPAYRAPGHETRTGEVTHQEAGGPRWARPPAEGRRPMPPRRPSLGRATVVHSPARRGCEVVSWSPSPGGVATVGRIQGGDVTRALVVRRVGPGRDREPAAHLADGAEALACHPARQFLEQDARVAGPVPEQCRGGHHHVGAGQQVPGHVGGVFDAAGCGERGAHPPGEQGDPGPGQPPLRPGGQLRPDGH